MKKPNEQSDFQTHIKEPRWQQVISVIGVICFVILWVWLAFIHK
jgi:hypothetical protein